MAVWLKSVVSYGILVWQVVGFCQHIPNIPLEVGNMLVKCWGVAERTLHS